MEKGVPHNTPRQGMRSSLATVTFMLPWRSSCRDVPRNASSEMKLCVKPLVEEGEQSGAPKLDAHLHYCLAGANAHNHVIIVVCALQKEAPCRGAPNVDL